MKIRTSHLSLLIATALGSAGVAADPGRESSRQAGQWPSSQHSDRDWNRSNRQHSKTPPAAIGSRSDPRWQHFDDRHQHNRSYWRPGHEIHQLPYQSQVIVHGHDRYYFNEGQWFRPQGGRYIVVAPPLGILVPNLPFSFVTIVLRGAPHFYANGVYYVRTARNDFMVVDPNYGMGYTFGQHQTPDTR